MDDLIRDPGTYQVVESPGATYSDRSDTHDYLSQKDLDARMPSQERQMARSSSIFGMGMMVTSRPRSLGRRR